MAKKDRVTELRQKSRFAAMEGLRPTGGLPEPPRRAMKQANKASKRLPYPVPPYPGANLLQLYRWSRNEWWKLGRWQNLALPVIIYTALRTWEKEQEKRDLAWVNVDRAEARRLASGMLTPPRKPARRKLFGLIPLPFRG